LTRIELLHAVRLLSTIAIGATFTNTQRSNGNCAVIESGTMWDRSKRESACYAVGLVLQTIAGSVPQRKAEICRHHKDARKTEVIDKAGTEERRLRH